MQTAQPEGDRGLSREGIALHASLWRVSCSRWGVAAIVSQILV